MTEPELRPRKTPLQTRSKATCAAVLEAAARILEAEGSHALTTNRVAERAGVSVGSLYQYFPGKEAILAELIRGLRRDMVLTMRRAAGLGREESLASTVELMVAAALEHHLTRPELARALERVEAELPVDAETRELKGELRNIVADVLAGHGIADAECVAFDLVALCHGLSSAAIEAGEKDINGLTLRLKRAVLGYLIAEPAGTGR